MAVPAVVLFPTRYGPRRRPAGRVSGGGHNALVVSASTGGPVSQSGTTFGSRPSPDGLGRVSCFCPGLRKKKTKLCGQCIQNSLEPRVAV